MRLLDWGRRSFDGTVISTFIVRMSGSIAGLLTTRQIVVCLSPAEQGYWYTFASILGITAFAELGAGQIIMRFVAYEFSRLSQPNHSDDARVRLRNLWRLALGFGFGVGAVTAIVAIPLGFIWMSWTTEQVPHWKMAWVLASLSALPMFTAGFLNSYWEGAQQIRSANARRALAQWLSLGCLYLGFYLGFRIEVFAWIRIVSSLVEVLAIFWIQAPHIRKHALWDQSRKSLSWVREFWPLQSRYAMTFVTGILVNGLYSPLIFRFAGPDEAGKYGMTVTLIAVVSAYASTWIGARQSVMANLVGRGAWRELRSMRIGVMRDSLAVYALGSIFTVALVLLRPAFLSHYLDRALPLVDVILALLTAGIWLFVNINFSYVRSYGIEPFVRMAWTTAVLAVCIGIPVTWYLGARGALLSSIFVNLVFAWYTQRHVYRAENHFGGLGAMSPAV